MKIAIVGNMNNNGFSLMRYFRDLGVDAHLLPFSNDGQGTLSHFKPEADTWEIQRWQPYIHNLEIVNGISSIVGRPTRLRLPPPKSLLRRSFSEYSHIVGSGIAPALLHRIGLHADIFFPYATGIEFVGNPTEREAMKEYLNPRAILARYVRALQIKGIRKSVCLNAEMSWTKRTFNEIGVEFRNLAIPMVYNREVVVEAQLTPLVTSILDKLKGRDLVVLSHARQMWCRPADTTEEHWRYESKNNDWLIRGFAAFVDELGTVSRAALVLFEYGRDVEVSKSLCSQLGLQDRVIWVPKMQRKEIMALLANVDVGVGEFSADEGVIWGGTAWEVLAAGKVLLQSFNFAKGEFERLFGYPPPPLLDVKSAACVTKHLKEVALNRAHFRQEGLRGRSWFDEHNGIGLARQWLAILRESTSLALA